MWKAHARAQVKKGLRALWSYSGFIGRDWGLLSKMTPWLYKCVIIPKITYVAAVWWDIMDIAVARSELEHRRRPHALSCVYIGMRTECKRKRSMRKRCERSMQMYSWGEANSIRLCDECLANSRMLSIICRYIKGNLHTIRLCRVVSLPRRMPNNLQTYPHEPTHRFRMPRSCSRSYVNSPLRSRGNKNNSNKSVGNALRSANVGMVQHTTYWDEIWEPSE